MGELRADRRYDQLLLSLSVRRLPWDDVQSYWKRSPLAYVGKVTTPTMLITGVRFTLRVSNTLRNTIERKSDHDDRSESAPTPVTPLQPRTSAMTRARTAASSAAEACPLYLALRSTQSRLLT